MTAFFYTEVADDCVHVFLHKRQAITRRKLVIPLVKWDDTLPDNSQFILAVLEGMVENFNGIRSEDRVTLPHEAVVGLTEAQAAMMGLPPAIPFAYDIRTNGMIDQSGFSLSTRWVTPGGVPEFITRKGAFAYKGENTYRIPSPVYEIVKAAEVLNQTSTVDDSARYQALAALHETLPKDEQGNRIRVDRFLGAIRVLHASSFSLQVPTGKEGFRFDPVLFSRKTTDRAIDAGRILDEAENLLTPNLQHVFAEDRFKRFDAAQDCYSLDDGVYVYIDSDLKNALGVVRKMQNASADERKAFICAPQRIIREYLGENIAADTVERLFVETEQYAQNVVGLGIWETPVIPWLKKEPDSWLPEKFGLQIGNTYVQIKLEDLSRIREEITDRFNSGDSDEQHRKMYIYETENGPVELPVTRDTVNALESMVGLAKATQEIQQNTDGKPTPEQEKNLENKIGPFFLLVEDNIDDNRYTIDALRRAPSENYAQPVALKSTLKVHQKNGLKWLIDAWTQGAPGLLLADDMGLGKTLQALTFLAWIKERKSEGHQKCKEPVLIIAPTGLLNNWQKEIEIHLREPYLGRRGICKAYGNHLSALRDGRKNDLEVGQVTLNRDDLRGHEVVLTTYETYRDYHHSFAGIKFSVAVLDECQKIKNPKSQVNRALASMNAEFVIAMTGTPIENAMEDLWTILDRAWPGFLGDLKSFSTLYSSENRQSIADLTIKLKSSANAKVSTPIFLRRMKEDILDGLPKKFIHLLSVTMPREQADAYLQVVNRAKEQQPPPMLSTLNDLRSRSLHPIAPEQALQKADFISYDHYIKGSARLSKSIEILDEVHNKHEKALLFIESIDMQSLMVDIIKKRYGLCKRPGVINGKTGSDKIQRLVDDFQQDPEFDVMILSPKVGGVGLTLTAANHVIHLSRWWNPAVEDQSTDRVYRIGQKKEVHVYYPMAIHPDTHIRDHSFDLKLNALLERKRQLSRDMLIPVESPDDTENLFRETVGFSTDATGIDIAEIDRMEPEGFEQWVLNRAAQAGYMPERTPRSWDKGADGVITHKETRQKFILQCKHSGSEKIHSDKVIEDLLRARNGYDSDAGLIALTNSRFSKSIIKSMNEKGIQYFDRDSICSWPKL